MRDLFPKPAFADIQQHVLWVLLIVKVALKASIGSLPQLLLSAVTFHIQKIPTGKFPTV